MKFGDQLQQEIFAPWRLSYIQYDVLKNELKARQMDHTWNPQDEKEFVSLLENELEKVYDFVTAKLSEVEARISYCERTIQTFMNNPTWSSDQNWGIMDDALTEVLFDVNDLAKFTRLNYIGFKKIIKKHDKWTDLNLQQDFVPQLRNRPLDRQRFDVAIVFISALHDICRLQGKPRTGNSAAGGDQSAFERATAKYWIHPDNITEVKSIIMLHLPVLIFNKEKRFESSDSAISSVYFDNPDFDLYTGRLQRDEGAEAIRFRWYGPMSSKAIFLERKTHHAVWLNGASVKDRFRLNVDDVSNFVAGDLTADECAERMRAKGTDPKVVEDSHFVAQGIQTSIQEKQLSPVLRAFYDRTAFQLPGDQMVRVSLDTNLSFIREDNFDRSRRGSREWRRPDVGIDYPFGHLDDSECLRFPYAVLETKLQTHLGQKAPEWLTKLVDSHLVHEVPRFSKYLHAASYFFRERMPLLPWWLSEMEIDIRKPRSTNFGLTRSKSFKPLIDGQYRRAMETEERRMSMVADPSKSSEIKRRNSARSVVSPFEDALYAPVKPYALNDRSASASETLVGTPQEKQEHTSFYSPPTTKKNKKTDQPQFGEQVWANELPVNTEPTLIVSSDVPLDYGPFGKNRQSGQNMEMRNLGEPVVVSGKNKKDIRLNMDDSGSSFEEKKPTTWRRALGLGGNLVDDPNKKGAYVALKKIKIEPKVFFANERTFISWLQFAALLLTVALNLLNMGDYVSRIAGGIFIGISIAVAFYALYRFEKRAWMINRRVLGRYDDLWGPAVLCALLVGALIVNLYLRFK
ncbi:VTC domain-containing protein [Phycomyces blakesleeanus]|uniref:VTC domain-containing protein n=1 Tax=Phycomyces blakesleeanus TaxID=4837 RepID=A0ABR3AVJ1_PHYBL